MEKEIVVLNPGNPNKLTKTTWKISTWWEKWIYVSGCVSATFAILGVLGVIFGAE